MTSALAALNSIPRISLAHLPTPLERMVRTGREIGIDALWVKRDDCTGLAFGGNKVRKLEFSLGAAIDAGSDCVVCGGVVQSNTARQVAAACAKMGLECHLGIMLGRSNNATSQTGYEETGNILLNRLYGAIIHHIPWDENRNLRLLELVDDLRLQGKRPYFIPYGASDALGAQGYVVAAQEIVEQCPDVGWILHASGSAGTQAGLIVGLLALGHDARVIGVDVDAQRDRVAADVRRVGKQTAEMLGIAHDWDDALVDVVGGWSAGQYAATDEETGKAILMAARLEGLALDPVYSGKSMAALIGLASRGYFADRRPVVWIHTGGGPGIFAFASKIAELSKA